MYVSYRCYARLHPRAVNCRKKSCGNTTQVRKAHIHAFTHTHTDRERERERSIRRNVYMEVEEDKKRAVLMEFMSFNGHLLLLLTLSTHFSLSMQIRPKKKLK